MNSVEEVATLQIVPDVLDLLLNLKVEVESHFHTSFTPNKCMELERAMEKLEQKTPNQH